MTPRSGNYGSPLDGAARKGAKAKADGLPESACPYDDKRKADGRLTWSRAFQRAWLDGYRGNYTHKSPKS